MGRPALSEAFKKSEKFKLRLTKDDMKMLKELSEAEDTNASDYIRKAIAEQYILFLTGKKH